MGYPSNDYCGCCGRLIPGRPKTVRYWCAKCEKHVKTNGSLVERTYFSRHGKPCPFDVGHAKNPRINGRLTFASGFTFMLSGQGARRKRSKS